MDDKLCNLRTIQHTYVSVAMAYTCTNTHRHITFDIRDENIWKLAFLTDDDKLLTGEELFTNDGLECSW